MPEKDSDGNIAMEILKGIRQIKKRDIRRIVHYPPVVEIRRKTGLSQSDFARLLGVSVRTLQEWEQGRRSPSGPAKTLLAIVHCNPKALLDIAV